jgi:hypothetical protein
MRCVVIATSMNSSGCSMRLCAAMDLSRCVATYLVSETGLVCTLLAHAGGRLG